MTATESASGTQPVDAVAERLNDPGVAASVVTLLDNAELLSTLVPGLSGVVARSEFIMDSVAEGRVADTGNRRALAWDGLPEPEQPPAVVLGQVDAASRDENRGELGPASIRWPHDLVGTVDVLLIADAGNSGNNRIMIWELT